MKEKFSQIEYSSKYIKTGTFKIRDCFVSNFNFYHNTIWSLNSFTLYWTMNTKSKKDASSHDNDENKSKQQQLKELIQLIQENDIKNLGSWLENYNDSKTLVCAV